MVSAKYWIDTASGCRGRNSRNTGSCPRRRKPSSTCSTRMLWPPCPRTSARPRSSTTIRRATLHSCSQVPLVCLPCQFADIVLVNQPVCLGISATRAHHATVRVEPAHRPVIAEILELRRIAPHRVKLAGHHVADVLDVVVRGERRPHF